MSEGTQKERQVGKELRPVLHKTLEMLVGIEREVGEQVTIGDAM